MPRQGLGSLLAVAMGAVLAAACNVADTQLTNTPVPSLSGKPASFDVIQIDQQNHRLYVSDRTDKGIDVFDISSARAKFLETIAMPSSPNGLAIAPDLGRLFVGTSGSVVIIDIDPSSPTRGATIKEVVTSSATDLLDYAAAGHVLFAGSGEGSITSIDAATGQVKGQFNVGQPLEQPRFNPADGMLYVTGPGTDNLLRIDPNDGTIGTKIALPKCQPGGLAINPRSNQALVSCIKSVMSVDLRTGKTQVFDKAPAGDVVSYDAKVDRFFVASPKNKPASVVGIFGGTPIAYITSVETSALGHSAAYDETNSRVYTPDQRVNKAGLISFRLASPDDLSPSFLVSIAIITILVVVIGLVLVLVARSADPIRRRVATPKAGAG